MKIKIIILFTVAISTVFIVGFISYSGLSKLMGVLQRTVQPDHREQDLETLLYNISETENIVRILTITMDPSYLQSYVSTIEYSEGIIEKIIEESKGDPFIIQHLDTIRLLFQKKIEIQKRLIRLSQTRRKINVYDLLMTEIRSFEKQTQLIDSLRDEFEEKEENMFNQFLVIEEEISSYLNETGKKESGFLKRLFGSDKKQREELIEQNIKIEQQTKRLDSLLASRDSIMSILDTLDRESVTKEIGFIINNIKREDEIINKELTDMERSLSGSDRIAGLNIKQHIKSINDNFQQLDLNETNKANSYFNTITNYIAIIGSGFSMLCFILIFIVLNDIKINTRYRKQLELAKQKAESLAKAKDDFLSNMSHEIRTPLNAIMGFIEQIGHTRLGKEQKKYIEIINHSSNHLLSLINDILDYAKIEAGKIHLEKTAFSIKEQAENVYSILYKKAVDKGIDFQIEFGRNIKDKIAMGDPVRLRQIIFNLADNAIKFTEKGSVKIKLYISSQWIVLIVADTGKGILNEELNSIFEKFEQGNISSTKKYGGTGLGLSIVKKLVELQNGCIHIKNSRKKGTEFEVKLPYIPASKGAQDIESLHSLIQLSYRKDASVLVVDDEEFNLQLFESILKNKKINYKLAKSGQLAKELFENESFDMVLLDLQMDDTDGFEVAHYIRNELNSQVAIIAVTAYATGKVKNKCQEAGMNEVLIKPVSEKDLLRILYKYIGEKAVPERKASEHQLKIKNNTAHQKKLNTLLKVFHNDDALLSKMTKIYSDNLDELIGVLSKNKSDQDLVLIRNTAHKIIPSTRIMEFDKMATKLNLLENRIDKQCNFKDVEKLIREILLDSREVKSLIDDFLAAKQIEKG